MVRQRYQKLPEFKKNLALIGICLLISGFAVATHNVMTPDEPMEVGYVEVETNCLGLDAGPVCLGIQKQDHTTYNYNNYTEPEEGTENYYRRVESELMAQAYNICNEDMEGYEWTSEAEYDGQTGDEWRQNENIQLLPCEQTFHRSMKGNQTSQ